ncbi:MAG: hypothetical protein NC823_02480, partial [Candidatus Omnitrophica bacterium]|nr:hypothetical protein [Candidatus Omnitrophota bacterium]
FLLQAMLGRKFLQDFSGFDSLTATSFTFGMIFVSMGVSLLAGFGTRALNRRKPIMVAATSLCFIAVSLLVMGVFGFPLGKFFLLPYLLLGFSSGASLVFSTSVREVNPAEAVGTAVGFLNGVCYLSIAVLMNLSGWVMDRYAPRSITSFGAIIYPAGAYQAIFVGCWLLAVFSLASSLRIRETVSHPQMPVSEQEGNSLPRPEKEKIAEEKRDEGRKKEDKGEEQLTLF